jgi:CelD/BcsL family acetyltransferase involved in cellulose biosynthesis
MKVVTISAGDLSPDLIARWNEILERSPDLASPYFRPEFVRAVAGIRRHVEVGIIRDGGQVAGFFPFERHAGCVARPVGGKLSDYQAVIAPADLRWTVDDIMGGCRLKAWEFDHQLASQQQLTPHFLATALSPLMDLSPGYEPYVEQRKAAVRTMNETLRKFRKFLREEDVRLVWHSTDESVFQQLMAWKSEQYHRTGLDDLFAVDWIVALVRELWETQAPQLAGTLCAMYAGERLAAVHFMLRTGPRLHSWFPAYDVGLSKRSPGMCLMLLIAQHAAEQGVNFIDLGKGDEDYKLQLASGSVLLGEGVVEKRRISAAMRSGWRRAKNWVRQSPLERPARASLRWLRQVHQWVGGNRD